MQTVYLDKEAKKGYKLVRLITVSFDLTEEHPTVWARYEISSCPKGKEKMWDTPALGSSGMSIWSITWRDQGETESKAVAKASGYLAQFLQETRDEIVDCAVNYQRRRA